MKEALAAIVLESKYRKREILESYLNEIYLGQAGFVSIYGVGEAAHRYFGKSLDELTTGEIAMIAGLIKGPNTFAPTKHRELAQQRRDVVLRLLRDQGKVTEEEWKSAVNEPVRVVPRTMRWPRRPISSILSCGKSRRPLGRPYRGLRIDSTLDSLLQRRPRKAWNRDCCSSGLSGVERVGAAAPRRRRGVDPSTGRLWRWSEDGLPRQQFDGWYRRIGRRGRCSSHSGSGGVRGESNRHATLHDSGQPIGR